ncbi:hypothetical protein [Cryptosporidium parvum Iowa II]|uniref:Uncharacterized protein n=2 Tax=Cryptosporidium parvum TaxID=5807 RepID=Q5CWZ6_CRYPI|nr:hypothetical protein [Cryptosporidium parvum Iowa II]QOY41197.1 Uncharacterized protein CPATCC_0014690 [Cryptosporidium parvum]WKS78426.1 hypothetical protein CPCDC_6g3120 [Cryptosporidium sp. 43IA8]EAK89942.1 hypothetical protein cgd6_3120 [Cryptosporidium parvum Iowa II]WRK32917.1 Uncharacterized protein cpbgf_6003120 [Cryptosporidium parvum]CAD98599.1 asparagine-rich protein, possible [Cryptosporidium parvum]|eukprot:QOY41197.1 hypothetical protein CPATCC_002857 [Cryptosporidium parvum]
MLNVEGGDIDEDINYSNYQREIYSNELEKKTGLNNNNSNNNNSDDYYYYYGNDTIQESYYSNYDKNGMNKNNDEYELNDNEVSLEMYSKELDIISLSKGIVENIWYVEIESNGEVVWSSVIACDFSKQENDNEENNRQWESLSSKSGWNKKQLFGNEVNIITKKQLIELLIQDGITNENSIKLFTSIGMWKSLFLTLNYSTYIRRKREMLYSKQVKDYIVKFNNRRETIERRMRINYNEDDRTNLIKLIYQGIQDLFGSISICNSPEIFKITYKIPFYWASLIANIYVFEKLRNYDIMLIIIEYISEVNPELIFEFQKYSKSSIQSNNNNMIEMLNIFNNELLQNTSTCFQEYLSDLLSITEKSKLILSSYITSNNSDTEKQKSNINIEENQSIQFKDKNQNDENVVKINNQSDIKRKPNYMRPTRLSEIRRQNSRKSINEKVHSKFEEGVNTSTSVFTTANTNSNTTNIINTTSTTNNTTNITNNNNTTNNNNSNNNNSNSKNTVLGQVKANIQKDPEKEMIKDNEKNPSSLKNDQNKKNRFRNLSTKHLIDSKENNEMLNNSVSNDNLSKNPTIINTNNSINYNSYDENKFINEKNNLKTILNILEEKSKSQVVNKVNFDDELFNIISELDKINFKNQNNENDISTNISEDFSQNIYSNNKSDNDKDFQYQDENINDETYLQVNNIKSHLDPYDWYYSSSNNENGDNENVQMTTKLNKLSPKTVHTNNEKVTQLISLSENDDNNHNNRNITIEENVSSNTDINELKYIESILDKEIEELQRQEDELASNIFF